MEKLESLSQLKPQNLDSRTENTESKQDSEEKQPPETQIPVPYTQDVQYVDI